MQGVTRAKLKYIYVQRYFEFVALDHVAHSSLHSVLWKSCCKETYHPMQAKHSDKHLNF